MNHSSEAPCSYCGTPGTYQGKIGNTRHYVCNDRECNKEFCRDERNYEREMDEAARENAERDDYARYR